MAEDKRRAEATEADRSGEVVEPYLSAGDKAGEYYESAGEIAGEYYEATRERAGDLDSTLLAEALMQAAVEAGKRTSVEAERRVAAEHPGRLVDPTGQPLERNMEGRGGVLAQTTAEGFVNLTINQREFERLSSKTREVLDEAALVQERIAKDQEEIELFKTETREVLRRLRAA